MSTTAGRARVRHPNRFTWSLDTLAGECVTVFFESAKRTYDQRRAVTR